MIEVVRTVPTVASTAEVWSILADFGAIARWAPNVDHSCLLSGQTEGVGMVRRIQSGRMTVVERVREWHPVGRSEGVAGLAYDIEGLPPVVRSVVNRWSLEAATQGSIITLTTRIDTGPRPPQQLVAKALGRKLGAVSDEMMAGLTDQVRADAVVDRNDEEVES